MPINHEHQLALLADILSNQQMDCCGSVAECEQIERLITSLRTNDQIDQNILPILEEIHRYSEQGVNASNLDTHIHSHQDQLSQWVDGINNLS
ncbi:YtzH-like family protein [Niallia sp.]|uniref:YtzH-like family protein n=1 Tax=Niallia sp. TaxID=2837523 RepID=UPI0028A004EE|nr:YtzH-like family protein [Niallia sp.]